MKIENGMVVKTSNIFVEEEKKEIEADFESNDMVRVLLYTANGLCGKFFNGIAPTNLYRESSFKNMIEIYLKSICRYNYHIDAIVEKLELPVQL